MTAAGTARDVDLAPIIKLEGSELSEARLNQLVEVRVDAEFRLPSRCTMRFTDPTHQLMGSPDVALGGAITIITRAGTTLFSGEITGVTVQHHAIDTAELTLTAHDKAHRLARRTSIRTFTDMTYADMVRSIAGASGLSAQCDATDEKLEHLLHARSDLDLLDVLADRVGFDWWVEGDKLHFKKPVAGNAVTATLGETLLEFGVRAPGMQPDSVKVTGWQRKEQTEVTDNADLATAALIPEQRMFSTYAKPSPLGAAPLVTADVNVASAADAKNVAEATRDRLLRKAVIARGRVFGYLGVRPGTKLTIASTGPTDGDYHVTKVQHVYGRSGFFTSFSTGDRRPASLVDTLGTGEQLAPGTLAYTGLVVGKVTNNNDDENLGRVKVQFVALDGLPESGWARVLSLGAGVDRGLVVLPEVNDEVLVAFEHGDLRLPVVLGGLYGSVSTLPPTSQAGQLKRHEGGQIQTRSLTSRLGHLVEVADGADPTKQHVLLQLAGGKSRLRLGKDKVDLEVPAGVPVRLASGSSFIEIGDDGSITIKGTKVSITADAALAVKGATVSVKSDGTADFEGTGPVGVKGQATVTVQGNGPVSIKGATVAIN